MSQRSATASPGDHLDAARRMMAFIDAAPSPYHACLEAATRLEAVGFVERREIDHWSPGPGAFYLRRGGTLVAWSFGAHHRPDDGFRLVGAHTDSPNLRIRPHADAGRVGYRQIAVEVYGSPLLSSWLDRDLGVSGRVSLRGTDGPQERLVLIQRPLLRIPQLAIHLDRAVSTEGLRLNPQEHLSPIWGLGNPSAGEFTALIAKELDVDPGAILAWDLMTHDLTPSALLGAEHEMVSAPRLDNLCSAWAGAEALAASIGHAKPSKQIPVLVLFDHEEVGSTSDRGADSALLPSVLERIVLAAGGGRADLLRALAASVCCSVDNAHATHPNYPERHEPRHLIELNKGPALKVNSNVRYATDATSAAAFVLACEQAGVPVQQYSHRGDLPCGSTIGPITASRLGVPTVDVGTPQLAMHSARELCGSADPASMAAALTAFFSPEA